ncbi:ATP-binding protein [Flavitalea sp. BT771]|uniref:ATP-binding protein n=1 Tax=Flavitalea sp. BT771 TaxID=3063329 RepID=UPI0026E3C6CB|nr:ATP-binding protein [Flavitalea sp. BT771]MDO6430585.1 ATP-binding protein [Flavitalea sp. BT771]MDV6219275.1 ATP-binding protein [Flavitalea sp. BT771]
MKHTRQLSTHSRVVKELLTRYKDTFTAFCELLNNSLQAKATRIDLTIDYTGNGIQKAPMTRIELTDNGMGVAASEFEDKILLIGTNVKKDGQGVGRFGALQIGEKMTIDTVAFDPVGAHYTRLHFPLDSSTISSTLSKVNLEYDVEVMKKKANSYYKVTIEKLHHNRQGKIPLRNRISEKFSSDAIQQSIFEKYPLQIFHREVQFTVNGAVLDPSDFVIGTPALKKTMYVDLKGTEHAFDIHFYQVKSALHKVKIFFYIDHAGIKSVAHEFTYSSDWYTPDLGTWFIYLDSSFFNSGLFRNIDLDSLGDEEIRNLKEFIKDTVNDFFKANNKRFEKFIAGLEKDSAYPASFDSPIAQSRELLFQKIAYIVEDDYKLLDQKNEKIRGLFYSLIDKALANGHVEEVFAKVAGLSDVNMQKFHQLLQQTELENIIAFSSAVAAKLSFIDFLYELTYGDVAGVLLERSQLHKIIERELWLFGEAYNGCPHLWSDRKIGNILEELRNKYLNYQPSKEDENLVPDVEGLDNITDLFFFNEKVLDNEDREIMVVELKSPRCAIGKKELQQIDEYAFTVENYPGLPRENTRYKFILVSSRLTPYTKSKMKSSREKYKVPFLYDRKAEKNIEVWVVEWGELIELNKRKLGYLSSRLEVKNRSVKEKFEAEYGNIINEKVAARLTRNKSSLTV